ncbi:MAG: glycosyltransferase family 39 protein [Vicinamibacterales bacterium]
MAPTEASIPHVLRRPGPLLLAAALVIALVTGGRDAWSEGAVSLQGDMPRYMMDGVFLRDLLHAAPFWPPDRLLDYAQHYYARYPALSLGHHPPLVAASLVPFFEVFGVSVGAARLDLVAFFLAAVGLVYAIGRRLFDDGTAGWAAALFASSPFVVGYAQAVLSELPAMTLVLAAVLFALRFAETGRLRDYAGLLAAAALSLTARPPAIFAMPAYVWIVTAHGSWRHFRQRAVLVTTLAGGAALVVLALALVALSPFNLRVVRFILESGFGLGNPTRVLGIIASQQIGQPLLWTWLAGVVAALLVRDRRQTTPLVWIAAVVGGVLAVTGMTEPARYSALAVPAYCLGAGSLWATAGRWRPAAALALGLAVSWQTVSAAAVRPVGAGGYEEAAEYVAGRPGGPTVLFSGAVDSGYFVFFVRKHDPAGELVVLRSDKVLTTSQMGEVAVEDRIADRAEIYEVLGRFGTRWVVLEDAPSGSVVLDWLREETHGPRFAERLRIPIATGDVRLRGVDLVVYEYLQASPPAPDAVVDLRLPVVGRTIRVPLSDLRPAR